MNRKEISRKEFLKLALTCGVLDYLALVLGGIGTGTYHYLNNEKMIKPPAEKQGKILLDLHTHIHNKTKLENLVDLLSSGITGLAADPNRTNVLKYEDLLNLPGVEEIDKGMFAKFEHNGNTGYFIRVQEVMSDHHVLALGCESKDYLDYYQDAGKCVDEIHNQNGLAILAHPYLILPRPYPIDAIPWLGWRLINEKEEEKVRGLCEKVDEIEVFNASSLNIVPFIAWFKKANKMAKKLAQEYWFVGIAVSDAHYNIEQVKNSGIYIPKENLSIEAIKYYVKSGTFERVEQYSSRLSAIKGGFLKFTK